MSVNSKKNLSKVAYYTLAILALISAGFFIYSLTIKDLVMWAKVIYFVWSGFVIGVIIFDIICTRNGDGKHISGWVIYVLSILSVIVGGALYFMNTGAGGLLTAFFNLFLSVVLISMMTSGYMIATWCVGESLVEHKTAEGEIEKKKMER